MKKLMLLIITTLSIVSASEYLCNSEYSWPIGYQAKNTVYLDNYTGLAYYYKDGKKILLEGYITKKFGKIKSTYFQDETNDITIKSCK